MHEFDNIIIYVGLSALLVSANKAMREPHTVERANRLAPRFCYNVYKPETN